MRLTFVGSKSRLWLLLTLLVLAVVTTACGGGGGGGNEPQQQSGNQQQGGEQQVRTIEVDSGEFYFDPSEITVKRGEPVELVVMNSGQIAHNISIDEFNVDQDYNPDQTIRVNFTPNQTGEFRIYCDIPGHTASGMVGTLIVE